MKKIIVVTGAARGIGKAIVEGLDKEKFKIILHYNKSQEKAIEIENRLTENGYEIERYQADLSKKEEAKKLVEYVIKKYNKIDILINNAGISQTKLFIEVTDEDWEKMINTNLNSVFYLTRETVKHMIHEKNGLIINISSIWGITGASCESHYAVTKAGIDALTKSLAKELGPSNLRVNSIAPGIIETDMINNLTEEEIEEIKQEIPLEKIGKPQEISKCVNWLIEDEYTTGQVISINGGWFI